MLRSTTPTRVAGLVALAAFAAFAFWYGSAAPLTQAEADHYMRAIERQSAESIGALDLAEFRHFLETDDGQPFYNVNLFKFRDRASYAPPAQASVSGERAFQQYRDFMVRTLPKRACHAVFATTRTLTDEWDLVATARYRSRRDIAELFASPEFAGAVVHKWAALDKNVRVPVQAAGLFATAYLPVAALLALLVLIVNVTERVVRRAVVRESGRESCRASDPAL
jgi:hypothetical protein